MRGTLFVISAPSGAGKTTLAGPLTKTLPNLVFSVSWTTRAPRRGERDGVDYHFTDRATFERKVRDGELLEWAEVHGHLYGTGRAETEEQLAGGRDVLLDIDVQGAQQVRQSGLPSFSIFILPPDAETLRRRLEGRATESSADLLRRLRAAAREVRRYAEFDTVVVNDDRERAFGELKALVSDTSARRRERLERAASIAARIVSTFGDLEAQGEGP